MGVALKHATVPFDALFMPAIFLITAACALATFALMTVILQKSRRWELQPLSLLFLASAMLDIGALLTIRLPGC